MFFVEAKWLYNYILSQEKPFEYDYKINPIQVRNKNGDLIEKELKYLPAKCKQNLVKRLQQNIISLSRAKKKSRKIGGLKFKSEYNSIDLNQYNGTHRIVSNKRMRVTGIKKPLFVHGLHQVLSSYHKSKRKPRSFSMWMNFV